METPDEVVTPIDGGYHIKVRDDGLCIDVLQMLYNWRIVLSRPDHVTYLHAWCYFGHGVDDSGKPKNMETALVAAMMAAKAWDGCGDPPGHDKKVF